MKNTRVVLALLIGLILFITACISIVNFVRDTGMFENFGPTPRQTPTPIPLSDYSVLEGKRMVGEIFQGTCKGNSWWIIPLSTGNGEATVLAGNPNHGLDPVVHKVNDPYISSCYKVEIVLNENEGNYVFRFYKKP